MAKLQIAGTVRYRDLRTPAKGARVRIYDLDSGGNGNDEILTATTDAEGHFSGQSQDWNDTNTVRIKTPLGTLDVNTPDLLLLEYRVDVDGGSHRGPFVHLGSNASAPILLPFSAPVAKAQREVVQVITLSERSQDKELYQVIEFGAEAVVHGLVSDRYQQHRVLKSADATIERFAAELGSITQRASVLAVDLVLCTHGMDGKLQFYPNERTSIDELAQRLRQLPAEQRKKLRGVFSTACFGASHLDGWISAGFKAASGSVGIYADSALSLPAFLAGWSAGMSFDGAVQAANVSDPARYQDRLARDWFKSNGRTDNASRVNSFREMRGDGALTINSLP